MIADIRDQFNKNFNEETYKAFLDDLNSKHPGAIDFRVSETPVFLSKEFTVKMLDACEAIVDVILDPGFKEKTQRAVPSDQNVPHEDAHTNFIAFDFGICESENGDLEPQLIEMQGFPTLFGFQPYYEEIIEKHFDIPDNFTPYLNGYDKNSYLRLFKEIVVNGYEVENVILLETEPHQQKTRIDFYCTQDYLGIPIVCLTELRQEGKRLFYAKDGRKIEV
ncbi:MAG: hypothetical protein ACTHM7_04895, partial [Ginsengibacter sp.]